MGVRRRRDVVDLKEVEGWKEAALNGQRFIKYKRGRMS